MRNGRPRDGKAPIRARLPPGQSITTKFPILSAGATPQTALADWSLTLEVGGVALDTWDWDAFTALPQTEITTDIHCVTRWSKLDTRWRGVMLDDLLAAAGLSRPPGAFVMAHCDGGYTTNVPTAHLLGGRAMVATHYDGAPIEPSHGGPARLLVPHLYFWKSAKWVRRLSFMDQDAPGFWEEGGYHMLGDPWLEQRYSGAGRGRPRT